MARRLRSSGKEIRDKGKEVKEVPYLDPETQLFKGFFPPRLGLDDLVSRLQGHKFPPLFNANHVERFSPAHSRQFLENEAEVVYSIDAPEPRGCRQDQRTDPHRESSGCLHIGSIGERDNISWPVSKGLSPGRPGRFSSGPIPDCLFRNRNPEPGRPSFNPDAILMQK